MSTKVYNMDSILQLGLPLPKKYNLLQTYFLKDDCKFELLGLRRRLLNCYQNVVHAVTEDPSKKSLFKFFKLQDSYGFLIAIATHSISQQNDTPRYLAQKPLSLSYRKYNTVMFHLRPSSWDERWHSAAWMRRSKKYLVYNTFRPLSL